MESIAYINALQAQTTDLGNAVNRREAELSEAKKRLLRLLDLQEEIDGWREGVRVGPGPTSVGFIRLEILGSRQPYRGGLLSAYGKRRQREFRFRRFRQLHPYFEEAR